MERFFDWVYGKVDEGARLLGEAAVAQARLRTATPATPRRMSDRELIEEICKRHDGIHAVRATDGYVRSEPYADEVFIVQRCPLCSAKWRITFTGLEMVRLIGIAEKVNHVIDRAFEAIDAHACQLELAP